MVCCLVIKPKPGIQRLLLDRQKQALLAGHMEAVLHYRPFIFNSVLGVYIFVKKRESFEHIQGLIVSFLSQDDLDQSSICDTTREDNFFTAWTKRMLTSKEISTLGWKRLISSFLLQADPYKRSTPSNNVQVFEKFRRCVDRFGTKRQKKFFKKKLNFLRDQVSLDGIDYLLKNE